MIISILAAAILGVAAVAGETAREAKTKSMISRLHSLLMEQYDTYANRRVKLRPEVLTALNGVSGNPATKGQLKAESRLFALREMMLMEVPDRWSDVLLRNVTLPPTSLYPIYLDVSQSATGRTELANVYLRTFRRIAAATNKITSNSNTVQEILENQGAECLYMVIMNACGDGEARTLFPESSIGDTDGDGAPEFLDGWGHPIEFVRWAPGFESDIQINANDFGDPRIPDPSTIPEWMTAADEDHDPFDLYRIDSPAFRLVPLVVSAGRDEEFGLATAPAITTWVGTNSPSGFGFPDPPRLLPWRETYDGAKIYYRGTDDGTKTATDNIHNHLISTR